MKTTITTAASPLGSIYKSLVGVKRLPKETEISLLKPDQTKTTFLPLPKDRSADLIFPKTRKELPEEYQLILADVLEKASATINKFLQKNLGINTGFNFIPTYVQASAQNGEINSINPRVEAEFSPDLVKPEEVLDVHNRIKINKVLDDKRKYLVTSLNEEIKQGKFPAEKAIIISQDGKIISEAQGNEMSVGMFADNLSIEEITKQLKETFGAIFIHSHPIPAPLSVEDIENHIMLDQGIEAHLSNGGYSILQRPAEGWNKALMEFRKLNPQFETRISQLNIPVEHNRVTPLEAKAVETLYFIASYMRLEFSAIGKKRDSKIKNKELSLEDSLEESQRLYDKVVDKWAKKLGANYSSSGIGDISEISKIVRTKYFQENILPFLSGQKEEFLKNQYKESGLFSESDLENMNFTEMVRMQEFSQEFDFFVKGIVSNPANLIKSSERLSRESTSQFKEIIEIQISSMRPNSLQHKRLNYILKELLNKSS